MQIFEHYIIYYKHIFQQIFQQFYNQLATIKFLFEWITNLHEAFAVVYAFKLLRLWDCKIQSDSTSIRKAYFGWLTWRNSEDVRPKTTDHVGHSLGDGSSKRPLLERRQLVRDDAVHLGQLSESVSHVDLFARDVVETVNKTWNFIIVCYKEKGVQLDGSWMDPILHNKT